MKGQLTKPAKGYGLKKPEPTFKPTWLIQRLQKPLVPKDQNKPFMPNPFSFGDGKKNGGLSDEAVQLLADVCRFDYMGSGEYECGGVQEAFLALAEAAQKQEVIGTTLTVPAKPPRIYQGADNKTLHRTKKQLTEEPKTIYVLCQKIMLDHVTEIVKLCALAEPLIDSKVRDYVGLPCALFPDADDHNSVGWLELDNGYLFFADKEMFEKMCKLFEVSPS